MELKDGTVVIELLPDVAPKHAERMKDARPRRGL
jgi:peptidylprolyl isomerase